MSNYNSVPLSSNDQRAQEKEFRLINPNTVLQKALQHLDAERRSSIVLRCDELPFVLGDENDWENVFSKLLNMILAKKPDTSKLFLHINCSTSSEEIKSSSHTSVQPFFI